MDDSRIAVEIVGLINDGKIRLTVKDMAYNVLAENISYEDLITKPEWLPSIIVYPLDVEKTDDAPSLTEYVDMLCYIDLYKSAKNGHITVLHMIVQTMMRMTLGLTPRDLSDLGV